MATATDRQSVKPTAAMVLLRERAQGQSLCVGKDKARALREERFLVLPV